MISQIILTRLLIHQALLTNLAPFSKKFMHSLKELNVSSNIQDEVYFAVFFFHVSHANLYSLAKILTLYVLALLK